MSSEKSSSNKKSYHVSERVTMDESIIDDIHSVIKEACNQIKDFNNIRFKNSIDIQEYFKNWEATKKKLKISFSSLEEIEKLK